MTVNVVFTGPAFDASGNTVVRSDLIAACSVRGNLSVQKAVRPDTDVLVASRYDTTKARAARQRGIAVLGYDEFIENFLKGVPLKLSGNTGGSVGAHPTKKTVKVLPGDLEDFDAL